ECGAPRDDQPHPEDSRSDEGVGHMKKIISIFCLALFSGVASAQEGGAREPYLCEYAEDAPHGVMYWLESDRIKEGVGTESRFVPYNSDSSQTLWRDATIIRDVAEDAEDVEGRSTSFNMVYNEKGWYVFIQANEPDIQDFIDEGRDVSLELFFVPGLENAP